MLLGRHLFRLLPFAALAAAAVACASGDMYVDVGPGAVTTQNETNDSGVTLDAAPTGANLPPPSQPSASEDAGSTTPSGEDSGSTTGEDSGQSTTAEDSAAPPPPPTDSGTKSSCPGYAAPGTPASCDCDPSQHTCDVNGCYGGYYCKLSGTSCVKKPSSC